MKIFHIRKQKRDANISPINDPPDDVDSLTTIHPGDYLNEDYQTIPVIIEDAGTFIVSSS